jgi:hypothetical protein
MIPHYVPYGWRKPYLEAMAECEPKRLPVRIYRAFAALNQRRLSHIHQAEQHDMSNAEEDLHRVIARHFGGPQLGERGSAILGRRVR